MSNHMRDLLRPAFQGSAHVFVGRRIIIPLGHVGSSSFALVTKIGSTRLGWHIDVRLSVWFIKYLPGGCTAIRVSLFQLMGRLGVRDPLICLYLNSPTSWSIFLFLLWLSWLFVFGHSIACGSLQVIQEGLNPGTWHWIHGVLTTGLLENSQY